MFPLMPSGILFVFINVHIQGHALSLTTLSRADTQVLMSNAILAQQEQPRHFYSGLFKRQ